MRRISKETKNANPELYGYEHPWLIPGNEWCGKNNPANRDKPQNEIPPYKVYFIKYEDADKDVRFIPCAYDFYKKYDNEQRKHELTQDRESRCLIKSKRYNQYVKCREDCFSCPYEKVRREKDCLSLEKFQDKGWDIPAPECEIDNEITLWIEVSKMSDEDQIILKLFNDGEEDDFIVKVLGLSSECIKKKRQRLIKKLKQKIL